MGKSFGRLSVFFLSLSLSLLTFARLLACSLRIFFFLALAGMEGEKPSSALLRAHIWFGGAVGFDHFFTILVFRRYFFFLFVSSFLHCTHIVLFMIILYFMRFYDSPQ